MHPWKIQHGSPKMEPGLTYRDCRCMKRHLSRHITQPYLVSIYLYIQKKAQAKYLCTKLPHLWTGNFIQHLDQGIKCEQKSKRNEEILLTIQRSTCNLDIEVNRDHKGNMRAVDRFSFMKVINDNQGNVRARQKSHRLDNWTNFP